MLRCIGLFSLLLLAPLVSPVVFADADVVEPREEQQATVVRSAPEKKAEKRRCRRVQQRGSNFKKRVCRTAAEWDADREVAARQMRGLELRRSSSSASGN